MEEAGLDLSLHLPKQSLWVVGDQTRLAQILGNLLHNADKFTDRGGRVTVELTEEAIARTALLRVRDTGKDACLIAMRGYGQEIYRRRALKAGFDQYLTKPIDLATLHRLIGGLTLAGEAQPQKSDTPQPVRPN